MLEDEGQKLKSLFYFFLFFCKKEQFKMKTSERTKLRFWLHREYKMSKNDWENKRNARYVEKKMKWW